MSTKKATIAKVANIAFGVFFSAMGAPAGVVLLSTTIVTVVLASYAIKRAENQEYSCSELALRSGFVAAAIACGQCLSQGLVTNVFLRVIGGVLYAGGIISGTYFIHHEKHKIRPFIMRIAEQIDLAMDVMGNPIASS